MFFYSVVFIPVCSLGIGVIPVKKKKKSFFLTGDLPGFGYSLSDKLECGAISRCGNLWGLSENAEKFMRDHP